jgi:hypothetical protein
MRAKPGLRERLDVGLLHSSSTAKLSRLIGRPSISEHSCRLPRCGVYARPAERLRIVLAGCRLVLWLRADITEISPRTHWLHASPRQPSGQ